MVMEWQPIETAPMGDEIVLVYGTTCGEVSGVDDNFCIATARRYSYPPEFEGYLWIVDNTDTYGVWMKPTHWMPLPETPK